MAAMDRIRCCVRGSIRRSVLKDDSNSFKPFPGKRQIEQGAGRGERRPMMRWCDRIAGRRRGGRVLQTLGASYTSLREQPITFKFGIP